MALDLLWSHIGQSAHRLLRAERGTAVRQGRQPKIRQQHLLMSAHQQVLGLDIAVDELLLMRVLQSGRHLLHIRDQLWQEQHTPLGVAPP